jgi:hypothetical protein
LAAVLPISFCRLSDSSAHRKYKHSRRNKQRLIKSIEKGRASQGSQGSLQQGAWAGGERFFSSEEFIS